MDKDNNDLVVGKNKRKGLNLNLLEKQSSQYGDDYLPGESRSFFEMFNMHSNTAKKWQRITMVSLAITAFALVWAAKVSTGIKYVPVLIQQNDIGQLNSLGVLQSNSLHADETVVVGQIYTYVTNLRSVIQDVRLEKERRSQLILMTSDGDKKRIGDIFLQQLTDAGQDTINVEITQIMPIKTSSKNSWKIQWIETYGNSPTTMKRYEAIFNTVLQQVTTNDPHEIGLNPTGLQISDFTMSQLFDSSSQKSKDKSVDN